jgi:hypothetical protein
MVGIASEMIGRQRGGIERERVAEREIETNNKEREKGWNICERERGVRDKGEERESLRHVKVRSSSRSLHAL